jgi:hypothetical protein
MGKARIMNGSYVEYMQYFGVKDNERDHYEDIEVAG